MNIAELYRTVQDYWDSSVVWNFHKLAGKISYAIGDKLTVFYVRDGDVASNDNLWQKNTAGSFPIKSTYNISAGIFLDDENVVLKLV